MRCSEKQVEAKFRKRIREIGGYALKFVSPGCSGVPDRLVFLPKGKIVLVEIKKPGERLRPLQLLMKEKFEKLGFTYYVIDSYERVEEMIHEVHSTQLSEICHRESNRK
jgi:hypothetical protein